MTAPAADATCGVMALLRGRRLIAREIPVTLDRGEPRRETFKAPRAAACRE